MPTPAGEIAFPEPAYSAHPHINHVFDTTTFRYAYQSLVTPGSVYEYDVATGVSTLLKQIEIPGGFDSSLYASERIFVRCLAAMGPPPPTASRSPSPSSTGKTNSKPPHQPQKV